MKMRLGDLAALVGGDLVGGDPEAEITGAAGVEDARAGDITFVRDEKHRSRALAGEAACVIVAEADATSAKPQLKVDNPAYAFARALALLHPPDHGPRGVHPGAHVAPGASLGEDVTVYPFAYVSEGARIGPRTVLYPGVFVGRGTRVGEDCVVYPGAVVREGVTIGNRVIVHAGAVIGADGFGFVFAEGEHRKVPQVGGVEIGDDVEIGACTCVDRATTGMTVVGSGTKIDNLVQVAHNVKVGRGVLLVAHAGVAGSTTVGDFAIVGGQVGVADHVTIAPGTRIASQSGVIADIGPGDFVGSPTMARRDYFRSWSVFTKLPELQRRVAEMERRLARFETKEDKGDA